MKYDKELVTPRLSLFPYRYVHHHHPRIWAAFPEHPRSRRWDRRFLRNSRERCSNIRLWVWSKGSILVVRCGEGGCQMSTNSLTLSPPFPALVSNDHSGGTAAPCSRDSLPQGLLCCRSTRSRSCRRELASRRYRFQKNRWKIASLQPH